MITIWVMAGAALAAGAVAAVLAKRRSLTDAADVHGPLPQAKAAAQRPGWWRTLLRKRADPTKATGLALTAAAGVALLGAIGVGGLLEMVNSRRGLARLDDAAARFGASHLTSNGRTVFRLVTNLGATKIVLPLALVVAIIEYRRRPSRAIFGFLGVAILGTVGIDNLVKVIVHRARPDIARFVGFSGPSFPSGHTAAAAATWAAIALVMGRGRSRRTKGVLAGGAATITVAVAASRVLLGVHWLTDVLAGAALGWGWFAITSIMFGGRLLHFGEPVEELQEQAERAPVATG